MQEKTIKQSAGYAAFCNMLVLAAPAYPLFLLSGYSLLFYLQYQPWEGVTGKWLWTGCALLVTGSLWFFVHFMSCFIGSTTTKRTARGTLATSTMLYVLLILIVETVIPATNRVPAKRVLAEEGEYLTIQKNIQRQLEHRSMRTEQQEHGVTIARQTNRFGWTGQDVLFRSPRRRVVFIGDSFLTVKSSKNLAQLVEEGLKAHDEGVDIINLSLPDTGIEDYIYRFHEFAFEYDPDHIVVFLYGANDLSPQYRYWRYRHPPFHVTSEAIHFLGMHENLPKSVLTELVKFQKEEQQFTSKVNFVKHFKNQGLTVEQEKLMYLVVFAYSGSHLDHFPLENVAPQTLTYLTSIWSKFVLPHRAELPKWRVLQEQYNDIFKLPRQERLARIAGLAAQYNDSSDTNLYLARLKQLPPAFLSELLDEPNATHYLWLAIRKYVLNNPGKAEAYPEMAEGVANEYLKLAKSFVQKAERQGVKLTFVLIPEASQVDEVFLMFWSPLIDFRELLIGQHTMLKKLGEKLQSTITVVNLLESSTDFSGAYWHFDGHWNEKGNAVAADIITRYLVQCCRKSVPGDEPFIQGRGN